ncbi:hypothetical protein Ocin01_05261 [Orchesella cincta]|uniref:Uncharacterized protein n=1 Tax=Orchesella cincta TaxID=48709 RepID=A0A1D2N8M5_ORCCI|nr:hypothetical protein Ocin01_05261 [Orchesella cincta]
MQLHCFILGFIMVMVIIMDSIMEDIITDSIVDSVSTAKRLRFTTLSANPANYH